MTAIHSATETTPCSRCTFSRQGHSYAEKLYGMWWPQDTCLVALHLGALRQETVSTPP